MKYRIEVNAETQAEVEAIAEDFAAARAPLLTNRRLNTDQLNLLAAAESLVLLKSDEILPDSIHSIITFSLSDDEADDVEFKRVLETLARMCPPCVEITCCG